MKSSMYVILDLQSTPQKPLGTCNHLYLTTLQNLFNHFLKIAKNIASCQPSNLPLTIVKSDLRFVILIKILQT